MRGSGKRHSTQAEACATGGGGGAEAMSSAVQGQRSSQGPSAACAPRSGRTPVGMTSHGVAGDTRLWGRATGSLFVQVVLDGGDDADGLHEAGVGGIAETVFAGFAGITALVGGENGEHALIGLPDGADLAP